MLYGKSQLKDFCVKKQKFFVRKLGFVDLYNRCEVYGVVIYYIWKGKKIGKKILLTFVLLLTTAALVHADTITVCWDGSIGDGISEEAFVY